MAKSQVQVGRLQQVDRPGLITWAVADSAARDALTTLDGSIAIQATDIGRVCRVGTAEPYEYYELLSINPKTWASIGKGIKGDPGQSAYQLWLDQGNTGNGQAFLDSLKGKKGDPGQSAYAIAVAGGYTGTQTEWIASLAGASAYDVAVAGGYSGDKSSWLASLKGAPGDSAYQVAVADGFAGTKSDWLASLQGKKGDSGQSAYEVAKAGGFNGTKQDWLDSLQGPAGDSAYQVAVAQGFSGNKQAWLDSLKGAAGASAYDVAVAGGYSGTKQQWLDSLQGAPGDPGQSAYDVAVANGFSGNRQAWLDSLQGKKGDPGDSAYQVAVNAGFSGTKQDWIDSLKGANAYQVAVNSGFQGTKSDWLDSLKGASAYDVAVANGFQGTKQEWLDSLHASGGSGSGSGGSGGNDGSGGGSVERKLQLPLFFSSLDVPDKTVLSSYIVPPVLGGVAFGEADVAMYAPTRPQDGHDTIRLKVNGTTKGLLSFGDKSNYPGYDYKANFNNGQIVLTGGKVVTFEFDDAASRSGDQITQDAAITLFASVATLPVAKAGPDVQVAPGDSVSVGNADEATEGGTLAVQWATDGSGTFADPKAPVTTYTASNTPEFYTLTKTVTEDTYGLSAADSTQLRVTGDIAPTITLAGDSPYHMWVSGTFSDPGATASDNEDGDISADIVVSGSVDTSTEGTYTLTYAVTDSGLNTVSVTRDVVVEQFVPVALSNGKTKTLSASDLLIYGVGRVVVAQIKTPTTPQKITIETQTQFSGVGGYVFTGPIDPYALPVDNSYKLFRMASPQGQLGEFLSNEEDTWNIVFVLDSYATSNFTLKPTDITVSWATFDPSVIPTLTENTQVTGITGQPWLLDTLYQLDRDNPVTGWEVTLSDDTGIKVFADESLYVQPNAASLEPAGYGDHNVPSGKAYLHIRHRQPNLPAVTMTSTWDDRYALSTPPTVLENGVGVAADNATEYKIDPPFYAYDVKSELTNVSGGSAELIMWPNYPVGDAGINSTVYKQNQYDDYYMQVRGVYTQATLTATWREATKAQSGVAINNLSDDGAGEPPIWYVPAPAGLNYGIFTVDASGGTGDSFLAIGAEAGGPTSQWNKASNDSGTDKKLQLFTSGEPMYLMTQGSPSFSGVTVTPTYAPANELSNGGSYTLNASKIGPYSYGRFLLKFTVPAGAKDLAVAATAADAVAFISTDAPKFVSSDYVVDAASLQNGHTYAEPAPKAGDYYIQIRADGEINGATITVDWT